MPMRLHQINRVVRLWQPQLKPVLALIGQGHMQDSQQRHAFLRTAVPDPDANVGARILSMHEAMCVGALPLLVRRHLLLLCRHHW